MILENKNIRLRPLKRKDLETTLTWRHDPELRMLAQFHSFPITYELEKEWIETRLTDRSDKNICFAIETTVDNNIIGYINFKNINWISRVAWLGILIGNKVNQGKGYGKEAMELGLNYSSKFLNLRKISLEVIANNTSAIKLYENLGFKKEGALKEHFFFGGDYYEVVLMSLFFFFIVLLPWIPIGMRYSLHKPVY